MLKSRKFSLFQDECWPSGSESILKEIVSLLPRTEKITLPEKGIAKP